MENVIVCLIDCPVLKRIVILRNIFDTRHGVPPRPWRDLQKEVNEKESKSYFLPYGPCVRYGRVETIHCNSFFYSKYFILEFVEALFLLSACCLIRALFCCGAF